jgi:hypothetical protein
MKSFRWIAALAATLVLGMATAAEAAPVTVGSPLTQAFESEEFAGIGTVALTSLPEPNAHVSSPVTGVVVSWHMIGAIGGPFRLRVIRPTTGGFLGAGSSAPVTPTGPSLQTFSANLPIQAGDLIGIDNTNEEDRLGLAPEVPGAAFAAWVPALGDGITAPPKLSRPELELGLNAVVQPAPTLAGISPASGSIKGGTSLKIAGIDFANVSGVSFGGVPAASFSVVNEEQLTAVAPTVKKAGAVDVTVTTVAGTTPVVATDKFTYKACVVPNLHGKKLKAAKKKLKKASCKLGKVKRHKGVTSKTGKVVKQSPKPGKQLAPGSKVNVTLG